MDVSRETQGRLQSYTSLILKWNAKINLIGRATEAQIWERHIEDSAQILGLAPASAMNWLDMGSGAGFPGLVVAILSLEAAPGRHVTLVESDSRKAAFCRTVISELSLSATVREERIEVTPPAMADIVSSRAMAPLDVLLEYSHRHLARDGVALFHKGANWKNEVDAALESWRFSLESIPSRTSPTAAILKIKELRRA